LVLGRPAKRNPDPDGYAGQIFVESRDAWHEARRLFPEWPGFHSGRYSPDLRRVYESLSAESKRELVEIERELDVSSSSDPTQPYPTFVVRQSAALLYGFAPERPYDVVGLLGPDG